MTCYSSAHVLNADADRRATLEAFGTGDYYRTYLTQNPIKPEVDTTNLTLNEENESVRACWYGDVGTGKTLGAIKQAVLYHIKYPDLPIYSNIPLFFADYKKIDDARVLFEIENPCCLLLDEMWHMADSRKSMSLINDIMVTLLIKSRRCGWIVLYTQQWYTQTDLRIRYITQYYFEPTLKKERDILHEEVYNKHGVFLDEFVNWASEFYDCYDTKQEPFTLDIEELRQRYESYKAKHFIRKGYNNNRGY